MKLQPVGINRLADRQVDTIEAYLAFARETGAAASLGSSHWTVDEVLAPNISDQRTVVSLAKAAADAYVEARDDAEWQDLPNGLNMSTGFGWQGDGLRGYIFADKGNATILVALKGTSPAVFDGEETTTQDKVNDNLFFSCCCAQGGHYFWRTVCDCQSTTYTCNQTCLRKALRDEHRYYRAAIELYSNVTQLYPGSNIWLTGHSLGGSVSSLLGLTFGIPTVTFEAPGEALAASRLGLPNPPESKNANDRKQTGTFHFGHTADPVFMGTCNGLTASCTLGGYAMETQCHTGLQCIYDTVSDFKWRAGIGYHKIRTVIDSVLMKYDHPPRCEPDDECVDCFNWKYFESNESSPSTSSSSISTTNTRTRTSTCKTPGWWGCLDETTGTTSTTSSSTSSTSSTTCRNPGWFGCNDPTSITTASFVASPIPTVTTVPTAGSTTASSQSSIPTDHRKHLGHRASSRMTTQTTSHPSTSIHCKTPGWFWGCYDLPSTSSSTSITSGPTISHVSTSASSQHHTSSCARRYFLGWFCYEWATFSEIMPSSTIAKALPSETGDGGWKDDM